MTTGGSGRSVTKQATQTIHIKDLAPVISVVKVCAMSCICAQLLDDPLPTTRYEVFDDPLPIAILSCIHSPGNKYTLKTCPQEQGVDVREELLKYHAKYYSSNLMTLAIVGKGTCM